MLPSILPTKSRCHGYGSRNGCTGIYRGCFQSSGRDQKSIAEGHITQSEIDFRCKKGFGNPKLGWPESLQTRDLTNLYEDLNPKSAELTNRLLTEKALTILKNDGNVLPLREIDTMKNCFHFSGSRYDDYLPENTGSYNKIDHYFIPAKATPAQMDTVRAKLKEYNVLLVGLHLGSISPKVNYGLTDQMSAMLQELMATKKSSRFCFRESLCPE